MVCAIQVPDMTKQQWELFLDWIGKTLRGQPWPAITMEQALELVPLAVKVCVEHQVQSGVYHPSVHTEVLLPQGHLH
jgi:hypothetical protein